MGRFIGIDLGTTNSVIAAMEGVRPHVLETREGRRSARSMVGLRTRHGRTGTRSEFLVGDTAYDNWPLDPANTVRSVKRLMGRGFADDEVRTMMAGCQFTIVPPSDGTPDSVRVVIGGEEKSPVQISAMILAKLKADAEVRLAAPVTHAVITVPAYFSQIQKAATRKAAVEAGFRVIKILDEPSAAAIAYGMDENESGAEVLLVYDLGGGTFDISILVVAGGTFTTLRTGGDMWLGGDNFDEALVGYALAYLRDEYPEVDPSAPEHSRFMVELRRAAQRAKETLSSAQSADLIVAGLLRGENGLIDVDLEVTRQEYEDLIRPMVARSIDLVAQTMVEGDLTAETIDRVLLAGNSTMTPLVQTAVAEVFGAEKILRSIHPKESVALGAAIVAAVLGGQMVCGAPDPEDPERECGEVNPPDADACARCGASFAEVEQVPEPAAALLQGHQAVAPFHYGARSAGDRFTLFVRKGDPYPTAEPQMREFATAVAGARMISIPIFGGDDLEHASRNERQGEAFAILPPGLPKGTSVRIRLWLDRDGIFQLDAHLADGRDLKPLVVEKGEALDRAIGTLERVEEALGARDLAGLPGSDEVDQVRERAFDHMTHGRDREALAEVEHLQDVVEHLGTEPTRTTDEQATTLVRFAEFVLDRYTWAFDERRVDELRALIDRVQHAQRTEDHALPDLVAELDRATDDLPTEVVLLLSLRRVIATQINTYDPAVATALSRELEEVEDLLGHGGLAEGGARLARLLPQIQQAFEAAPPPPGGRVCKNGHRYRGGRFCPECHADYWELVSKGGGKP